MSTKRRRTTSRRFGGSDRAASYLCGVVDGVLFAAAVVFLACVGVTSGLIVRLYKMLDL